MIDVDTSKILSCGENIVKLSEDLDVLIQDFFLDIDKLVINGVWFGESADKFLVVFNNEKIDYIEFSKKLKIYGNGMKEIATKYDGLAKKCG